MATQVRVVQALNLPQQKRRLRRPSHRFNVKAKPYEICPTVIAPVLPGETMSNLLLQARAVSDPIKEPLIGWHYEHYFFYCPLPALVEHYDGGFGGSAQDLIDMFIDPTVDADASAIAVGANVQSTYAFKGAPDYVSMCLDYVRDTWFRDEDDRTQAHIIENYPSAYVDDANVFNSVIQATDVTTAAADGELPYVDLIEETDPTLTGFDDHRAAWLALRDMGLSNVTFEDYLASHGVTSSVDVPDGGDTTENGTNNPLVKGETIRFARDWTYPTNHVDPATGVPSSAVSWSIAERADKKRFFKFPGFVFGVCVVRPKIYLGNQKGAAVGLLQTAQTWLPAVLNGYPYASLIKELDATESAGKGILQNQTQDFWIDVKDLFLHGDQFVNHSLSTGNSFALPLAAEPAQRHVTEAMVDALFVTAGSEYIRQDGVARFTILSRLKETTP